MSNDEIEILKENFITEKGVYITRGMFTEFEGTNSGVPYNLGKRHNSKSKSLRRLYMEEADLTEYTFVEKYLLGWSHWEALLRCNWFVPHIKEWRNELEIKIRSEALKRVIEESRDTSSKLSFAASKFLVQRGWATPDSGGKGRPSKQDIKEQAIRLSDMDKLLQQGYEVIKQ